MLEPEQRRMAQTSQNWPKYQMNAHKIASQSKRAAALSAKNRRGGAWRGCLRSHWANFIGQQPAKQLPQRRGTSKKQKAEGKRQSWSCATRGIHFYAANRRTEKEDSCFLCCSCRFVEACHKIYSLEVNWASFMEALNCSSGRKKASKYIKRKWISNELADPVINYYLCAEGRPQNQLVTLGYECNLGALEEPLLGLCSFIKQFIKHLNRKRDALFAWLGLRLFNVQFAENAQEPINYALPAATRQNAKATLKSECKMWKWEMGNVKYEMWNVKNDNFIRVL